MSAETNTKLNAFFLLQTGIQGSHGIQNFQPSPYCSVSVIFMCLRIAEVDKQTITEKLGDMPIVALDHLGTYSLICTDDFPVLFGVELGGEVGGIDQVAEHHRELPSFRVRR